MLAINVRQQAGMAWVSASAAEDAEDQHGTTNLTASLFTSQLWFSLGNVSKVYPMHSSLNFQVEMINLKDVKPTKSQHNCQPLVVTTLEEIKRNFPSCQL